MLRYSRCRYWSLSREKIGTRIFVIDIHIRRKAVIKKHLKGTCLTEMLLNDISTAEWFFAVTTNYNNRVYLRVPVPTSLHPPVSLYSHLYVSVTINDQGSASCPAISVAQIFSPRQTSVELLDRWNMAPATEVLSASCIPKMAWNYQCVHRNELRFD